MSSMIALASTQEVLEMKMTVPQVVKALGVSSSTVHRLIHSGELPAYRVGTQGHFRVPMRAVREYLGQGYYEPEQAS